MKWTRSLDEILAIEDGRLDLVARRAPGRAPVQEHGLPSAFAAAKAASTSPFRHAMPASSLLTGAGAAATGGAAAGRAPDWAVVDGSGDFEHAVSATAASRTAIFSVMIGNSRVLNQQSAC
jgi:hypothetical protein